MEEVLFSYELVEEAATVKVPVELRVSYIEMKSNAKFVSYVM